MRRFALRLTAALLTFALGVLMVTLRNGPRWSEVLWMHCEHIVPAAESVQPTDDCYTNWANAAESKEPLGWDLTYYSVISKPQPRTRTSDSEERAKQASQIQKHISEWQGDPIISSILIEAAVGHLTAVTLWFIRTKNDAYYLGPYPLDKDYSGDKYVIATQAYDAVFEKLSCWQPIEREQQAFGSHGYRGFLNMYKEGKSRQMILTDEDFDGSKYQDDHGSRHGPFVIALEPLIVALDKSVKHSTQSK